MQKKIPFLDLKEQYLSIKDEITDSVLSVLEETAFTLGPFVNSFEENFAKYLSAENIVGVSNGTDALHLCMRALGIKEGDEVILPANTFIATAWGVCHVGATPVFVDCDSKTWNIDATAIEERITSRTKAVIGVHLYGQPFDVASVKKICEKHNLFLIEDCAQAHGAVYHGKSAGTMGDMAAFSFYPGKNLGAYGEAGAVASANKNYTDKVRMLINQGQSKKYYHDVIGYNMRMDGVQAAVLNVKLKYLSAWTARRNKIAKMYLEGIKNEKLVFQQLLENTYSVYHLFVVTAPDRDDLMQYLNQRNIFPGIHYPVPIHLQKAFVNLNYGRGDFPNTEILSAHCLSLPIYPELKDDEVEYIIDQLNHY